MDAACDRLPRRGGALETARDPVLEGLDCDLIHFPTQRFRPSSRPSVYNPHDLQHLHFPDFFTPRDVTRRERLYRAGCAGARAVAVSSSWVKRDLVTHYGLSPDKVRVIPWGIDPNPGVDVAADRDALARRLGSLLQAPFALYPAATWEHKNHSRLLEALAYLRDTQGLRLNVVCCGHRTGFYPRIQRRVESLRLGDQVAFPGVLPAGELDCAYRQALCVVVPSLFEASSALLREAWRWRRPVACAAVTSLPEQAGGSALLFEPTDPQAIAGALHRLATDPGLRADLVERGARRIARFPWEHTARAYRALYRTVAGRPLTTDEIDLLNHDWMTAP
jgi:glycosyltransferase involved in cell wall biosynthesis